jgi:uncharacterized protein (TIGR00255 family)
MQSMTAFARLASQTKWGAATWEIKSINHRYNEIQYRLPDSFRPLEIPLREKTREYVSRGKLDCVLRFSPNENLASTFRINQSVLKEVLNAHQEITQSLGDNHKTDPMKILQWPGIVITDEFDYQELNQEIMQLYEKTLNELVVCRKHEGTALAQYIKKHLATLEQLLEKEVRVRLPQVLNSYRNKLIDRLAEINIEHDSGRLEQEMALIAARLDVAEETERLATHIIAVQNQLKKTGAVGRHLDFLMQELHRETNTLGSKCNDATISHLTVDMKVLIEQMREQIQNIE